MNKSNFSTLSFFCVSISLNKVPKGTNFKGTAEITQERKRVVEWRKEESREREKERSSQLKKRKSNVWESNNVVYEVCVFLSNKKKNYSTLDATVDIVQLHKYFLIPCLKVVCLDLFFHTHKKKLVLEILPWDMYTAIWRKMFFVQQIGPHLFALFSFLSLTQRSRFGI